MLMFTNQQRKKMHLRPLVWNKKLHDICYLKSSSLRGKWSSKKDEGEVDQSDLLKDLEEKMKLSEDDVGATIGATNNKYRRGFLRDIEFFKE